MALMTKGKARVLAFDFGFTPKSTSKMVPMENSFRSDAAMGDLIKAYPSQVVLGCLYSGVPTPFVKATGASAFPPLFKDGYSTDAAAKSGKYNYPESPTYPLQNYLEGKYLGRTGSFTVPPFRAVDNVPRWVPLWFPGGGKAHAYNLLGGKQSKLPFEMKGDNEAEILILSSEFNNLATTKARLLTDISSFESQFFQKNQEKQIVEADYEKISRESSVYNALGDTINNFTSTLKLNPSLAAVIKPQIESRKKERIKLITTIFQRRNNGSASMFDPLAAKKDLGELELTVATLKKTMAENPAITAIIKPQITKKTKAIEELKDKIKKTPSSNDLKLSAEEERELLKGLRIEVDSKKKVLDRINKELSKLSLKIDNVRKQIAQVESEESLNIKRNNQLLGKSSTELVETNSTLRLVYKRSPGDNGAGRLVDSLPNEVPLYRDRAVYTLGVEALLAYYGLSESNVVISEGNTRFMINDKSGNTIIDSPLSDGQFLEVNWFSRWSEKSAEKSLVMNAKRAYGEKDFDLYLSMIPAIFESFLSKVKGFELPTSVDEYAEAMKELDLGEKQLVIAEKLLLLGSHELPTNAEIPAFDQLMTVIESIAYYFIPPSLNSKHNPMCGMRDVIQNSRFMDEVETNIDSLKQKILKLKGPTVLGAINAALSENPSNQKLLVQKNQVTHAIVLNESNLALQQDELSRIKDFFSRFEDAIILVGPEEATFQDLAPTPFDKSATPKVGVHGNLIKTLTSGFYIKRLPIEVDHAATFGICIIMALLAVYQGNRSSWVQAVGIVLLLGYVYLGFVTFSNTHVVWPITAPACAGISTSFIGLAVMVVIEQKAKGRLKGMFGSYVSSELVDQMVESGEEPSLGGQETAITAFFSDVQAFSSFSELLSPTGLVDLMNEYLTAMTNILQEERGTLDKYIGDAIVAMYGAPIPMKDHAYQSVRTAILMQQEQIKLREKWSHEEDKWGKCHGLVSKMQTRIGCNTGTATVGNMGALDRFNYTMMGDMVNLAARCESGAKAYGAYIMITEETKLASEKTRDDIAFRYLDRIVVKGRKQPVAMFEPTGFMSELTQETQDCLDCFKQGIDKYLLQDWDGALGMFEKAKNLEPNKPGVTPGVADNPSIILIDRCQIMKENPPGSEWDGVYVMTSK
ncbi:MAG: adenylate/guanylate cyclase domain-containing protein [Opitutales bacterium]|nr:adenylate/guanylate cyclase domain-containing protein [Opitutales bacterium]